MTKAFEDRYEKEKNSGVITEQKKRWDFQDQEEFSAIPIEVLIDSEEYLGLGKKGCTLCSMTGYIDGYKCFDCEGTGEIRQQLYETHRQDIINLWRARKENRCNVAVFQEGIGSGKTFKFASILWLMVTEVLTKVNPLRYYSLSDKSAGISFICMSRNARLAKEVTFQQVLPFFQCSFYESHFPPQIDFEKAKETKKYPSILKFPKNVVIFPGTGSALSAIGFNLFGAGIDEANYLAVVDDSKQSVSGGTFDAAAEMHSAIISRMTSRFEPNKLYAQNKLPGLLVFMSNPRYAGDFTERMIIKSRTDKTIFARRRCTWEAKPKEDFKQGTTFKYDTYNRRLITTTKGEVAIFNLEGVCINGEVTAA